MILDSRTSLLEGKSEKIPVYSTSDPYDDVYVWIQPSISRQVLDPAGSRIVSGIYVQTQIAEVIPVIEPELAWEFEAWEAASDEALFLFESECD